MPLKLSRLRESYKLRGMATVIPLGCVPIGVAGLVMGSDSSRAFTLIPGGGLVAHLFGAFMAIGGVLVLLSILYGELFTEVLGLGSVAVGLLLYGGGVYIGLGLNGLIAGSLSTVIALGALARVSFLTGLAEYVGRENVDG